MLVLDGKQLRPGRPFTHNGIQYPANWLRLTTLEEKEAIGITEVPDPAPVDTRFYWDTDIPKQLEDTTDVVSGITTTGLKTQWKEQQDQTAYSLLAPTDWYVVRKTETDEAIPVGITSFRGEVRNISNQRKVSIDTASSVENLIGITTFSGLDWPNLSDYT
jgi:hypothetical protein